MDLGVLGEPPFAAGRPGGGGRPRRRRRPRRAARGRAIAARPSTRCSAAPARWCRPCTRDGRIDAVLGLGGGGGTAMITAAMRTLPVGVPKLMVSTMASGNTAPYVDVTDITLMSSVVDIAGLNPLSRRILANAAGAIAGMVDQATVEPTRRARRSAAAAARRDDVRGDDAVRDGGAAAARSRRLRRPGLPRDRHGRPGDGVARRQRLHRRACSTSRPPSGATRSSAACCAPGPIATAPPRGAAIPQVVSAGALDMVNFGGIDTVPRGVRRPHLLPPHAVGDADAHDRRRVPRDRAAHRGAAQSRDRRR